MVELFLSMVDFSSQVVDDRVCCMRLSMQGLCEAFFFAQLSQSEPPPRKWRELFNVIYHPKMRASFPNISSHPTDQQLCPRELQCYMLGLGKQSSNDRVDPIIRRFFHRPGGTLSFGGCSARKWGGAIHLEGDLQHSGRLKKHVCVCLQTTLVRVMSFPGSGQMVWSCLIIFFDCDCYQQYEIKWSRQAEPFSILFEVRPNMFSTLSCHRWLCQRSRLHSFGRRWSIPEGRQKTTAVRCCQLRQKRLEGPTLEGPTKRVARCNRMNRM